MEQSPSQESNRFSISQIFPTYYGTLWFTTAFTNARHLFPVLSQIDPNKSKPVTFVKKCKVLASASKLNVYFLEILFFYLSLWSPRPHTPSLRPASSYRLPISLGYLQAHCWNLHLPTQNIPSFLCYLKLEYHTATASVAHSLNRRALYELTTYTSYRSYQRQKPGNLIPAPALRMRIQFPGSIASYWKSKVSIVPLCGWPQTAPFKQLYHAVQIRQISLIQASRITKWLWPVSWVTWNLMWVPLIVYMPLYLLRVL
jgi:hypothetical protein